MVKRPVLAGAAGPFLLLMSLSFNVISWTIEARPEENVIPSKSRLGAYRVNYI